MCDIVRKTSQITSAKEIWLVYSFAPKSLKKPEILDRSGVSG